MNLPERVQQLLVTHFRRIESNLYDFCVSCLIRAHILIRRVRRVSADVAHGCIQDSRYAPEGRFNSPEAPCTKCRVLCHEVLPPPCKLSRKFNPFPHEVRCAAARSRFRRRSYGFARAAAPAVSAFSFSCAGALYGLFTEAASVNAAFASGTFFRFSSANPSRYWLRA